MAVLKCKMCGGDLVIEDDMSICECEYCGTKQTVPKTDDEKKVKLFERANRLRFNCDFDKAASVYENIISEYSEEPEGYWGLLLCKYGIEYVDDPATGKKVATCHRSSFESIMDDVDFEMVMENSDSKARSIYREEAKYIEEIRKGILEVSGKEEPYDIFICYKETDENGERTLDSVLAQDVYDELTHRGFRVFFSRITLEDKLGVEYEPYIFAALNSAKIMLAFGTSYDFYNAVWVKNEWSRYLKLMAKDKSKHLIPCFKGIDAYDIPKEFNKLQSQDMGKIGAMQDLMRGIEKLLSPEKKDAKPVQETVIIGGMQGNASTLLKRGFMALEDGEWSKAVEFFEQVLNLDAENGQAYWGELLAEKRCGNIDKLSKVLCDGIREQIEKKSPLVTGSIEYDDKYMEWKEKYIPVGMLDDDEVNKLFHSDIYRLSKMEDVHNIETSNQSQFILENNKLYLRTVQFADEKILSALNYLKEAVNSGIREIAKEYENREGQYYARVTAGIQDYFNDLENVLGETDLEYKAFIAKYQEWEKNKKISDEWYVVYRKELNEWNRKNDEYSREKKQLESWIKSLEEDYYRAAENKFTKAAKQKKISEQINKKKEQLSLLKAPEPLKSILPVRPQVTNEPNIAECIKDIKEKIFAVYDKYYLLLFDNDNIDEKYYKELYYVDDNE